MTGRRSATPFPPRSTMVVFLTIILGACASPPMSETPAPGSPEFEGYRASGNEPFWTVMFGESTMEFFALGATDTVTVTRPEAERLDDGWRFDAVTGGGPFVVRIEERGCGDSMSGRPFPHTVEATVNGRTYTGCGGDTASLLTGGEWSVTSLEGAATSGRRPTMSFSADGALTGNGGCNGYRGTYEITGEGLVIGPAAATRMACADDDANAQEARFFSLIGRVTRFDIAADGDLVLYAGDSPIIRAER